MIYTIVLHHPARSTACLRRTLLSLEEATKNRHIVNVIVQGKKNPSGSYPLKGNGYELRYTETGKNFGIGGGFKLGIEKFLNTSSQFVAKIDDDIVLPPRGWDILRAIHTIELHGRKGVLAGVMMGTKKTTKRLLTRGKSPNGIPLIIPIRGHHRSEKRELFEQQVQWSLTDFADVGCTLYTRRFFMNNTPDENLFVGGIGLDLVLQGEPLGYKWAVCSSPKSVHLNKDCHTHSYAKIRKNKRIYKKSCLHFFKKWGRVPLPLAKAAGIVSLTGRIKL